MRKLSFDTTLPKNLPLLVKDRVAKHPDLNIQAAKNKDGKFQYYTYASFYDDMIVGKDTYHLLYGTLQS